MSHAIAYQVKQISGLGAGASFMSNAGFIWVKAEGTRWMRHDGHAFHILTGNEVVEAEGYAHIVTFGNTKLTETGPKRTRKLTKEQIAEQMAMLNALPIAATVVGRKKFVWVNLTDGRWARNSASGAVEMLRGESLIEEFGPFTVCTDGTPLPQKIIKSYDQS